jgi:hypothetical protein
MVESEPRAQAALTTAAADWPDVERLFGVRGEPSRCWCRFFALTGTEWAASSPEQLRAQLRTKFDGGDPAPGVLAFRGGYPVGWWAVEPAAAIPGSCAQRFCRRRLLRRSGILAGTRCGL